MESISLVLPMFNEEEYVAKTVQYADSILRQLTTDYEVIIVDDASTDSSGTLADKLASSNSRINVVHHQKNRKLGGALKTGFRAASKNIAVYTDMDMPFDLERLRDLLPLAEEFDVIKGRRSGGRESWLRMVYSYVYNRLINALFRVRFRDINFSLKIIKRRLIEDLSLKSEGSFIDAEFMVKAQRLGYSIKEVELKYNPRSFGISRLSSIGVILKILYEMIKFFPEVRTYSKTRVQHQRVIRCYHSCSLRVKVYNFFRLMTCPFGRIINFFPQANRVIDLGCGTGIFFNLIKNSQDNARQIFLGLDREPWKIAAARGSLAGERGVQFEICEIVSQEYRLSNIDCAVMIDVLCYFNWEDKKNILQKCFYALSNGGVIIIKDINKDGGIRYLWILLQEIIAIKCMRLTRCNGFYFGSKQEYSRLLETIGFSVNSFDLSKGYPYPHILYVATKK